MPLYYSDYFYSSIYLHCHLNQTERRFMVDRRVKDLSQISRFYLLTTMYGRDHSSLGVKVIKHWSRKVDTQAYRVFRSNRIYAIKVIIHRYFHLILTYSCT